MKKSLTYISTFALMLAAASCVVDEGYSEKTSYRIMDFAGNLCRNITNCVLSDYADPKKISEDSTLVITDLDVDNYDFGWYDSGEIQFTACFRLLPESTEKFPSWELEFEGNYHETDGRYAVFYTTTPIITYWKETEYSTSISNNLCKKGKARVDIYIDGEIEDWCEITFKGENHQSYLTSRD